MDNSRVIALIPARGGSKRIPNKNIKNFCGKPIIYYSIRMAYDSGLFSKVVVSTDSQEIASIAKEYGAEIPFVRPSNLADDNTSTADVIAHAIDWFYAREKMPEYLCCIYPTAPLIQKSYLKLGYEKIVSSGATTVVPITTYPYTIFRSLKIAENGKLEMIWPEHINTRSQDLPEAYHDAGQFYWIHVEKFRNEKKIFGRNSIEIMLPRYLVQDIDNIEDWEIAEILFYIVRKKLTQNRKEKK